MGRCGRTVSSVRGDRLTPHGTSRRGRPTCRPVSCSTIGTFMALRTRVWSAGKLVLLGGGLVATYVLFAAASMRIALRSREVQVPDFTNRTANEANAMAGELGLAMRVDDTRRPDPKIAAGRVLAQEPAAGSVARRPRSVKIWLSAGQRA